MQNTMTIPRFSYPEEERFQDLMNRSYRKVYNMAYRLVGNRVDAEDLTQEAFFRAYRGFEHFEGDKPFENWILRIVNRLFLDLLRSKKRRVTTISYDAPLNSDSNDQLYFDVPDQTLDPEKVLMNHTFCEEVQTTLDALSPEQQLLITLADIEQVPYKEIASILGKPIGTIRSRLHRAHKAMRAKLNSLKGDSENLGHWVTG